MKPIHNLLLIAFLTISAVTVVVYTACNKNKCHNVTCLNQGVCDGGICVCPVGFEGGTCQTLSRDKFISNYNGGDSCGSTIANQYYTPYSVQLLTVLNKPLEMTLTNVLNNMADSAVCTIWSTDSFTFIGSNNSTNFTGWGKLRNDSLWLAYHVSHDTTSYDCRYFGQSLR